MDILLNNYILFWVAILGLCLGSFYNVVILRSLTGESIVLPPSKCPKCGEKLKPWHNIPVLSYLFLGGKCAFCKKKISIQYPLVELLTMGLFIFSFYKFGLAWQTLFAMFILSGFLIMAVTDIKEKVVDCNIAIILIIIGFLYNWFINNQILDSLYGLILGVIIMETLARIGYLFSKGRAFGEADTYVAAALGACFAWQGLLQILYYTLVASMFLVLPMFIYKQYKKNNKLIPITFIIFLLVALLYKTVLQNLFILILLFGLTIFLSVLLLRNLKNEEELLYLPLVPAFSLATLCFLFF